MTLMDKLKNYVASKIIQDVDRWSHASDSGVIWMCPDCQAATEVAFDSLHTPAHCTCGAEFIVSRAPIDADSSDALDAMLASVPGPLVVDFWAAWCGPCIAGMPQIIRAAAESDGRYVVVRSNVEIATRSADVFEILAMPTMVRIVDGVEVDRMLGGHQSQQIQDFALNGTQPS